MKIYLFLSLSISSFRKKKVSGSKIRHYEIEEGLVLDTEQKEKLHKTMLDPSGYLIEVPKERTLVVLKVAESIEPILFQMTWSLVKPAHGFFITSDNPLVREVDYPETDHPIYGDLTFPCADFHLQPCGFPTHTL